MKAYIRYSGNDTIISGVLVKANKKPTGVGWVEIPLKYCCEPMPTVTPGARQRAFVKYTQNGQVVGSSTIIRKTKPQSGLWVEVPYNRCCQAAPTIPFTVEFLNTAGITVSPIEFLNTPPLTTHPVSVGTQVFQIPTDTTVVGIQLSGNNTSGQDVAVNFYDTNDTLLQSTTVPAGTFGPIGITPTIGLVPDNYIRVEIVLVPQVEFTLELDDTLADPALDWDLSFTTQGPNSSTPVNLGVTINNFNISPTQGSIGLSYEGTNDTGNAITLTVTDSDNNVLLVDTLSTGAFSNSWNQIYADLPTAYIKVTLT